MTWSKFARLSSHQVVQNFVVFTFLLWNVFEFPTLKKAALDGLQWWLEKTAFMNCIELRLTIFWMRIYGKTSVRIWMMMNNGKTIKKKQEMACLSIQSVYLVLILKNEQFLNGMTIIEKRTVDWRMFAFFEVAFFEWHQRMKMMKNNGNVILSSKRRK